MDHRIKLKHIAMALAAVTLIACAQHPTEPVFEPTPQTAEATYSQHCREPRPDICTKEYRPVCATRDNGVRCVTTPCDSTDLKTYGNGCTACSDQRVYGYNEGRCATEG